MIIDRYEQPDIVENCKVFLEKIKELNSYMIEFDKNGAMKPKIYLSDCIVEGNNQ